MLRLVTMKRVSAPSSPTSTRAMICSMRLQLAAPSKNSLKRHSLPSFGAASKRAFFQRFDMDAQRRGGCDAENVVETIAPTPVENLGAAIMAVGMISVFGQLARIARKRRRRKERGRSTAAMKRPRHRIRRLESVFVV